jgi:hypothetical protein
MTRPDPQPILRMVDIHRTHGRGEAAYMHCVASPCTS